MLSTHSITDLHLWPCALKSTLGSLLSVFRLHFSQDCRSSLLPLLFYSHPLPALSPSLPLCLLSYYVTGVGLERTSGIYAVSASVECCECGHSWPHPAALTILHPLWRSLRLHSLGFCQCRPKFPQFFSGFIFKAYGIVELFHNRKLITSTKGRCLESKMYPTRTPHSGGLHCQGIHRNQHHKRCFILLLSAIGLIF